MINTIQGNVVIVGAVGVVIGVIEVRISPFHPSTAFCYHCYVANFESQPI